MLKASCLTHETHPLDAGMKSLGDYLHKLGFKYGIYTDRGSRLTWLCPSQTGSRIEVLLRPLWVKPKTSIWPQRNQGSVWRNRPSDNLTSGKSLVIDTQLYCMMVLATVILCYTHGTITSYTVYPWVKSTAENDSARPQDLRQPPSLLGF